MINHSKRFNQLDTAQAWEKIKPFCAYQERCHSEVVEKLNSFGMDESETAQILSRLIEEGFLNEERFALQYAGGHFRLKKWGRIKISYALRQKKVSVYCIRKALAAIDEDDYLAILRQLAEEKFRTLTKGRQVEKNQKCRQFLLQRGFEAALIDETIKAVTSNKT